MTDMERKKKEVELIKVTAAKAEMEYKILEREQDILRIQHDIEIQEKRIDELKNELGG